MVLSTSAEHELPQGVTEQTPVGSAREFALDYLFTRKSHTQVEKRNWKDRLVSGRHGKLVFQQTFPLFANPESDTGLNELAEITTSLHQLTLQMIVDCDKNGQPNRNDIIEVFLRGKEERKYLIMPDGKIVHVSHPTGHPSFDFLNLFKYVSVDITAESVG